jgi:hypothetical protein
MPWGDHWKVITWTRMGGIMMLLINQSRRVPGPARRVSGPARLGFRAGPGNGHFILCRGRRLFWAVPYQLHYW